MTDIKIINSRKIGGIKLLNSGLKGVEITYETLEVVGGVSYTSEDNKKSTRPAHRELKDLVKLLGYHLMVLCGYDDEVRLSDFEVTGIKAGSDRFLITGKFRSWGDKIIAVNTPLIKEVDGYESYDEVSALVDKIYLETDLYLKGVKKIKRSEVVADYMKDVKKKEGFDINADFNYMSKEEMDEMLKDFDKNLGICVTMENGKMVIATDEDEEDKFKTATIEEYDDSNNVINIVNVEEDNVEIPVIVPIERVSIEVVKEELQASDNTQVPSEDESKPKKAKAVKKVEQEVDLDLDIDLPV